MIIVPETEDGDFAEPGTPVTRWAVYTNAGELVETFPTRADAVFYVWGLPVLAVLGGILGAAVVVELLLMLAGRS